MNLLASKMVAIFLGVGVVFFYTILSSDTLHVEHKKNILLISNLTQLPSISFSNPFNETRVLEYEDYSNNFYLDMKKETFSGFVYAK